MAIKINDGSASEQRERAALAGRLTKLAHAARSAEFQAGLWADEVRQQAEARLGIGPFDDHAWGDREYGTALDLFGRLSELREAAEREAGMFR